MNFDTLAPARGDAFPAGVLRLDYHSSVDDALDWAMLWPPDPATASQHPDTWVVVIHGYGSNGDQLFVRKDIRENWLPDFRRSGLGVLTPNLRGNAWMSPNAAADMRQLLQLLRDRFDAKRFIFASGSMGATSNLIYGILHPHDVAGIVALGFVSDLADFIAWCCEKGSKIDLERAEALQRVYGGTPAHVPDVYHKHNARAHAHRLTMPVYLSHATGNSVIPISHARLLVGQMPSALNMLYAEIPAGNHDSPLWRMSEAMQWILAKIPPASKQNP